MNKQEKIDKIYKEIANKELSFGCKIEHHNEIRFCLGDSYKTDIEKRGYKDGPFYLYLSYDGNIKKLVSYNTKNGKSCYGNVKGYPVLIGDVLDWRILNNEHNSIYGDEKVVKLLDLWKFKRLPIEEQSQETIDYIHNLINND